MTINFLFFENYETLDIFGPIEILARIDGVKTNYVSMQGGLVKSRQGFAIQTSAISDAEENAVLVIPGGQGTRVFVNDEHFISELKNYCESAEYVLSICTGSALLAKTGLLYGRKATSNKKAFDWVKTTSQNVSWQKEPRWVKDGKFYTSSGVSAGMDMALGFVKDLFGDIEKSWSKKMFESDFAKIEYIENDNVVFHTWKKEAHFDDYRSPVMASLELLREHKDSIFIVDARNGFEDTKEDVEWGFNYFLPELKKTGCKIWGFILPKVSHIEGEIDLWTKEIEKNFRVIRSTSYEEVLSQV